MKSLLIKISLVIFGLLIGILICEVILQIFDSKNIIKIDKKRSFANDPFLYSSTLKYRVKPYLIRDCTVNGNPKAVCYSNYLGLRDVDYEEKKPENIYRIVMIGDSLTYGPGVNEDETYPRIFEKLITKEIKNKKFEVINMGMIFYSPQNYYNLYEEIAKKFDPDLIVLSFHLLTDPYDAYEFDRNKESYYYKSLPDKVPYKISQPLKEKSLVYRSVLSAYYRWANSKEINVQDEVFNGDGNRFQFESQMNTESNYFKKGWDLSEENVNNIIDSAKSNGSKIIVVSFPIPAQIIPNEWENLRKAGLKSSPEMYSNPKAQKKFNELCIENNWNCLSLSEDLKKTSDLEKLFLKGDIHLTGLGNATAAASIYKFLINKKILQN